MPIKNTNITQVPGKFNNKVLLIKEMLLSHRPEPCTVYSSLIMRQLTRLALCAVRNVTEFQSLLSPDYACLKSVHRSMNVSFSN